MPFRSRQTFCKANGRIQLYASVFLIEELQMRFPCSVTKLKKKSSYYSIECLKVMESQEMP